MILHDLPDGSSKDSNFYLASDLNNWVPNDANFLFKKSGDQYYLNLLGLAKNKLIQFKITKGSWDKAECDLAGFSSPNRILQANADTTVLIKVEAWSDLTEAKSTVADSNRLISDGLFSKALNEKKSIWVYLPSDYYTSTKKYSVIYMHDGLNLFDRKLAFQNHEWQVDESLDSLQKAKHLSCIIVGVDAGPDRINEMLPYPTADLPDAKGPMYLSFITKELMPYINGKYKTKRKAKNTAIIGSSMGGLISLYAILEESKKFGAAGIFSIAQAKILPTNAFILQTITKNKLKRKQRIFLYYGNKESETMEPFNIALKSAFEKRTNPDVKMIHNKVGRHDTIFWVEPFRTFLEWFLSEQ